MFASNQQQVFRRLSANNENVVRSTSTNGGSVTKPSSNGSSSGNGGIMNGAMSKTPAANTNKTRRALGDISNRKGQNESIIHSGTVAGATNLKKAPTPGGLRLFSQQKMAQQNQQRRSTKTSKRPEVSFLPRSSSITQAPLVTIFPDAKSTKSHAVSAPKSILKNRLEEVIDDIEVPAGRMWVDQQDDYDDSSIGSLSLPGAATLLEDYHAAARKRHAALLKSNLEEEQREQSAFEEYEKKLLEEEGKSRFRCAIVPKKVALNSPKLGAVACIMEHS